MGKRKKYMKKEHMGKRRNNIEADETMNPVMIIPNEITQQIPENNIPRKHILFLGLSVVQNNEIPETDLFYGDKSIGKYHYQLEPVILYLKEQKITVDTVFMLSTPETKESKALKVGDKTYDQSVEAYFSSFIKSELGDNTKIEIIDTFPNNDVNTVIAVISQIRQYIKNNSEFDVKLSIDIHGGKREMQMLIQSIITLLEREKIIPDKVYTVEYNKSKGTLKEVNDAYDINRFVIGMSEFLTYGRYRSLEAYYKNNNSNDDFIKIIKEISDSIQLCQMTRFDEAIREMKKYIDNYKNTGDYNDLFIESIKASFGELMDKKGRNKVINKVKWCIDNDFIQQALTIIESEIPDELINRRHILKYSTDDDGNVSLFFVRDDRLFGTGEKEPLTEVLEKVLKDKQRRWEKIENYAFNTWSSDVFESTKISGLETQRYLNLGADIANLERESILRNVAEKGLCAKLGFKVKKELSVDQKKALIRFVRLHLALKRERNETNHAAHRIEKKATTDEIKVAIQAYIELMGKVLA